MDIELHHFRKIGSTMDAARDCIDRGAGAKLLILADEQTDGRGRIEGRTWTDSPGSSLLMTIALKQEPLFSDAFPLKVGLGVFDLLSRLAADRSIRKSAPASSPPGGGSPPGGDEAPLFLIKWPNDIMGLDYVSPGNYKKLCGILCESSKGWLLAGIGLNLRRTAYPDSLIGTATSLEEIIGVNSPWKGMVLPEIENVALEIAKAVVSRIGDPGWMDDYKKYMWMREKNVGFMVGHPSLGKRETGRIFGVDNSGRLLLRDERGEVKAFLSGEISKLRGF